jgi:5'-nucleotidase
MIRTFAPALAFVLLAACANPPKTASSSPAAPVTVKIIGFNDFHGNLEVPHQSVDAITPSGEYTRVPVGGAAYFASAADRYRAKNPNTLVLSAGDMISGSPITSSLFLDEPTIEVMNRIGVDYNALGNHEFDRGWKELLRMQNGGCEKLTSREPCQVDKPFRGAQFPFLAANVITPSGKTLFPATAIRKFGKGRDAVTVGIIGLPLKDVSMLASPAGLTGLQFKDEIETINALVPKLKAQGADAIVVLIHQGLYTKVPANDKSCGGVSGELLKILAKLDPRVDLVVSGHTHWAYVCDYGAIDPARPFLVTSAGLWAEYLTDIDLVIDPATKRVLSKRADNIMVQSESYQSTTQQVAIRPEFEQFSPRPDIAAYVGKYVDAVKAAKERPVGKAWESTGKPSKATDESKLGNLIADGQLAATRSSGAQFALMNNTGIRADLNVGADKTVTFGAIFAVQPFANELKTATLSGADLLALFQQQFDGESFDQAFSPSANVSFSYDLSRPLGARVFDILIDGKPIDPVADYRLTMNSFLASGGDSFTIFRKGRDVVTSGEDLDAMEAWIAAVPVRELPPLGRVKNLTSPTPAN